MSKKKIILRILLLFAIVLPCFLSISPIDSCIEIDGKQNNTKVNNISSPKSSGVTKLWNDTTVASVTQVAVSADGRYMAAVTNDASPGVAVLTFYNTSDHDGIPIWSYDLGDADYDCLAISENGSYVVATSYNDDRIYLFNHTKPEAGNSKQEVWYSTWGDVLSVDISANGSLIVASGDLGIILYNNTYPSAGFDKTNEYLWYDDAFSNNVVSVGISSDGRYIVAGTHRTSPDETVYFYNTTEYNYNQQQPPMWSYDTGNLYVYSVAISAKGDYAVASGSTSPSPSGDEIFVFNKSADGGNPEWSYDYTSLAYKPYSIDISADGESIIVVAEGPIFDKATVSFYSNSKRLKEWGTLLEGIPHSVDITADGQYIVIGTNCDLVDGSWDENSIFLYEKSAKPTINALPLWAYNTSDHIYSVSISDDGHYIGAGGEDAATGALLFYYTPPTILPPAAGDDDDDDDDDGIDVGIVVLIIVLGSVGVGAAVIAILIKKKR